MSHPLIDKLVELDRALHNRQPEDRWYDTPFEPWVPRMAFLALWSPPWARGAGLLPFETWDEVREARLVPVLNFKGRAALDPAAVPSAAAGLPEAGEHAR